MEYDTVIVAAGRELLEVFACLEATSVPLTYFMKHKLGVRDPNRAPVRFGQDWSRGARCHSWNRTCHRRDIITPNASCCTTSRFSLSLR
jgi:hypothetical protein